MKTLEDVEEGLTDEQKEELEQLGINKNSEGVPSDVTSDDLVGLQTRKKADCFKEEQDSFNKLGFETPVDFDGDIYQKTEDNEGVIYIGYVRTKENVIMGCVWEENGDCYMGIDGDNPVKYNLKPIKKEWYEDENNFPCVAYNKSTDLFLVANKENMGLYKTLPHIRPATKEEVLKLVIGD